MGEFEGAVQNSGCDSGEMPWVSMSVNTGTTPPAGNSMVEVAFDSTGLSDGIYTGTLCITSNDLDESLIWLPVTLMVEDYLLSLPAIMKP